MRLNLMVPFLLAASLSAQQRIDWCLPGDFEATQKRAEAEKRLILIKGISFGVDASGARDATKGCW